MILSDLGSPDAVLERRPGTIGRGMLGPFGTVLGAPGDGFGAAVGASGSVWGCLGGVCGRLEATLAPRAAIQKCIFSVRKLRILELPGVRKGCWKDRSHRWVVKLHFWGRR